MYFIAMQSGKSSPRSKRTESLQSTFSHTDVIRRKRDGDDDDDDDDDTYPSALLDL